MTRAALVAILEKHGVRYDGLLTDLLAAQPSREGLEKILCDYGWCQHPEHSPTNFSSMAERLMAWATGTPPCANCQQWQPGAVIKVTSLMPPLCAECGKDVRTRQPRPGA